MWTFFSSFQFVESTWNTSQRQIKRIFWCKLFVAFHISLHFIYWQNAFFCYLFGKQESEKDENENIQNADKLILSSINRCLDIIYLHLKLMRLTVTISIKIGYNNISGFFFENQTEKMKERKKEKEFFFSL